MNNKPIDYTSPVQPSQSEIEALSGAVSQPGIQQKKKKRSSCLYLFASIGGCITLLLIWVIVSIGLGVSRGDGNIQWDISIPKQVQLQNTYTDPETGESITVTSSIPATDAIRIAKTMYQLMNEFSLDPKLLENPEKQRQFTDCIIEVVGQERYQVVLETLDYTEADVDAMRVCLSTL